MRQITTIHPGNVWKLSTEHSRFLASKKRHHVSMMAFRHDPLMSIVNSVTLNMNPTKGNLEKKNWEVDVEIWHEERLCGGGQ